LDGGGEGFDLFETGWAVLGDCDGLGETREVDHDVHEAVLEGFGRVAPGDGLPGCVLEEAAALSAEGHADLGCVSQLLL
jgi:hypothetical protein